MHPVARRFLILLTALSAGACSDVAAPDPAPRNLEEAMAFAMAQGYVPGQPVADVEQMFGVPAHILASFAVDHASTLREGLRSRRLIRAASDCEPTEDGTPECDDDGDGGGSSEFGACWSEGADFLVAAGAAAATWIAFRGAPTNPGAKEAWSIAGGAAVYTGGVLLDCLAGSDLAAAVEWVDDQLTSYAIRLGRECMEDPTIPRCYTD